MSINRVMISGNLTRDPELRGTSSGTQVLTFGVAVNDRRRNPQTNEWEDYANFIDCVMFGTRAQALANYLSKGTKVAIEGKLRYSSWENNGQRRSKIEVIVDEVEFLSSRNRGSQGNQQQPSNNYRQNQNYGNNGGYQQPAPQSYGQGGYAASAPSPAPSAAPQSAPAPSAPQTPPSRDVYDEDIPF